MEHRPTVAFDLDETLGVPITDGRSVVGFQLRRGAVELLSDLRPVYRLVLWTVSGRAYVDKVFSHALTGQFDAVHTWDDHPCRWKDVRALGVDYLVDDGDHHRAAAARYGLASRYIIIPAYGSPDDVWDPDAWAAQVRAVLLPERA